MRRKNVRVLRVLVAVAALLACGVARADTAPYELGTTNVSERDDPLGLGATTATATVSRFSGRITNETSATQTAPAGAYTDAVAVGTSSGYGLAAVANSYVSVPAGLHSITVTVRIDSASAQYQISPDNMYGYPSAVVAAFSEAAAYWTGRPIPDAHDQRHTYACVSQPSCSVAGQVMVFSYSLTLAQPGTVVVSGGTYSWSYAQGAGQAAARSTATVLSIVVQ